MAGSRTDGEKGVRAVRLVALVVAYVYFLGFSLALYGITVRSSVVSKFVSLLSLTVPGFLPSPYVSYSQGVCHFDFLVVMVLAFLVEWLATRYLHAAGTRSSRPSPRRRGPSPSSR